MIKARVEIRDRLAYIETELGQKAVVPVDTLCALLRSMKLEPEDPEITRLCSKNAIGSRP